MRGGIFDVLGLVEDEDVEVMFDEGVEVAREQCVGGEDEIGCRNLCEPRLTMRS